MLVAAIFAVYAQVRHHEFVNYDDYVYLAAIDSGVTLEAVRNAFTHHIVSNWVPVTWMMLLVDHELYGRDPAGYHLTNVALHAANAVLLFWLLQSITGATGRSAFVAGVFALHPLHVESVAWMSERKDVLSGLFFLLTLHAYVRYHRSPDHESSGRSLLYWCIPITFAIGLMAKPMLVTLPFVLLLLDYWPLGRIGRSGRFGVDWIALGRATREKIPLFALAALASGVAILTQDLAGSLSDTAVLTVARRCANALDSYWIYLAKTLWPTGLAAFYPHPVEAVYPWRTLALGLAFVAVTAATIAAASRRPYALVGWLWYVGMLVPVIGLVQVGSQARADRYTYLPQIGIAICLAWGANDALSRIRFGNTLLRGFGVAILLALAVTSYFQVGYWKNTIALHSHAASVTENNFRAHNGLAAALRRAGRFEESAIEYQRASQLSPRSARTHIGRAEVLAKLDRVDEAIDAYRAGLQIAPRHIRAHINLAYVLLRAGQVDESIAHFERALELDGGGGLAAAGGLPFLISLHRGFGRALVERSLDAGDDAQSFRDRAIEQFEALLELRPNDASAHRAIAEALIQSGQIDRGRTHLLRARELESQQQARDPR